MERCFKRIAALLLALMLLAAAMPVSTPIKAEPSACPEVADPDEEVTVIVKLEGDPVLKKCAAGDERAAKYREELAKKQDAVCRAIFSGPAKEGAELLYRYTQVFNGLALRTRRGSIEGIKALAGVADCRESPSFTLLPVPEAEGSGARLSTSTGFINADDMWAAGYTGQGMTVAVIDTGIKADHPAFAAAPEAPRFDEAGVDAVLGSGELCAEQRFSGELTANDLYYSAKLPFTFNYYAGNTDVSHAYAMNDHGTHVASIAAGCGQDRGVAYNAQIIVMQVFNGGSADWVDIVAALEDCAYLGVDSVNMSFGADCGFTYDEDLEGVMELLSANGVSVAAASGNAGTAGAGNIFNGTTPTFNYDNGVTSTPATLRGALSVAAGLNSADMSPAGYSSWGTTSDLRIKPEIMAPGDNIEAAVDPDYSSGLYNVKSGTSMATPHIAGGLALVKQYVRASFPGLTPSEAAEMVTTLVMCTAHPAKINGVPYSPRQQGAGRADLAAAASTGAYIDVPGCARPKLELGDDDERSGVFTFGFDIVNFSERTLDYTVNTRVLTETISQWLVGYSLVNIMNHGPEEITERVSVNAPSSVSVPAGSRRTVSVTVRLGAYANELIQNCPNGMYIEGFVELDGETDLCVPFLGFYGDWEYGAVFDRKNYYDQYLGITPDYPNEWGTNRAAAYMGETAVLLGMNPFASTTNFLLDRASVSPNGDGNMDAIDLVHTYMLRNAETFRYEVLDADTGEQYFVQDLHLVPKAVQNNFVSFYQPVGAEPWSAMQPWGGAELADGTHCVLRMTGYLQGYDEFDPAVNENAVWQVPVTVDRTAPRMVSYSLEDGSLTLSVRDNHYTAYVGVYADEACTALISEAAVEEMGRGALTELTFGVGGREDVWVKLGDYAGNVSVVHAEAGSGFLKGDCDLNGVVESADALLAMRAAMGLAVLEGDAFAAGDIDGNGAVSGADALQILRYVLRLIDEL